MLEVIVVVVVILCALDIRRSRRRIKHLNERIQKNKEYLDARD